MKRTLSLITAGLTLVVLVGCSSTYTIRTKDGQEFQSLEKPDITDDRYVKFETKSGRKILLKQDEVSSISED